MDFKLPTLTLAVNARWSITPTTGRLSYFNTNTDFITTFNPPEAGSLSGDTTVTLSATTSASTAESQNILVKRTQSALARKTWTSGQALEQGDDNVLRYKASIDDNGNVITVFVKDTATRDILYAARGTVGASGSAPTWSAPVVLDVTAGGTAVPVARGVLNVSDIYPRRVLSDIAFAPNGNAYVAWLTKGRCTASSYRTLTTTDCAYMYGAAYNAASNTWSAAEYLADTPLQVGSDIFDGAPQVFLDNQDRLAILYKGWLRTTPSANITEAPAVMWRNSPNGTFQRKVFDDMVISTLAPNFGFGIDQSGNMVFAGQSYTGQVADIVAYRGDFNNGFQPRETLDSRGDSASFDQLAVNGNGTAVVSWEQRNGFGTSVRWAATLAGPTGSAWVTAELAADPGPLSLYVKDNNDINLVTGCSFRTWSAGTWSAAKKMPQSCAAGYATRAANANGDILSLDGYRRWYAYDATENAMVQPTPRDVTGSLTTSGSAFYLPVRNANPNPLLNNPLGDTMVLLSKNGTGAIVSRLALDTLPTVAAPAGDGRTGINNLWGFFFK